jgi:hypothetical protein
MKAGRDDLLSEVRDAAGGLAELVSTVGEFFHVESQADAHAR